MTRTGTAALLEALSEKSTTPICCQEEGVSLVTGGCIVSPKGCVLDGAYICIFLLPSLRTSEKARLRRLAESQASKE